MSDKIKVSEVSEILRMQLEGIDTSVRSETKSLETTKVEIDSNVFGSLTERSLGGSCSTDDIDFADRLVST